jgi:importin-5
MERVPAVAKKNAEFLKELIQLIFQLMIDIDEDIEEEWMRPKEGFRDNENDGEEDNVNFGKGLIDKIISAVGDEKCLPILSEAVQGTLANENDWRFKNAGLMAFSQVGEYIDDISKIGQMVPIVV